MEIDLGTDPWRGGVGAHAMCPHEPRCPDWNAADAAAARVVADRGEQGWSLLCNGLVLFDDLGALAPGLSQR